MGGLLYKDSGVDTELAKRIPLHLRGHAERTRRRWVEGGLGGFASIIDLSKTDLGGKGLVRGRLALTCDGVGTKVLLAREDKDFAGIGRDAVAMCVNDLLVLGAEPLALLDYVATGKIEEDRLGFLVGGIASACEESGCALVGGETAEMPGLYEAEELDVACFALGLLGEDAGLGGEGIRPGDRVIGLGSSGLHSNGFSLVRRVLEKWGGDLEGEVPYECEGVDTFREALLLPTRLYVREVLEGWLSLKNRGKVRLMAHVTGGGLADNLGRGLCEGVTCVIERGSWKVPEVFSWLASEGGIEAEEMASTFNMGLGYVGVVRGEDFREEDWEGASVVGYVEEGGEGGVAWS
jgi:phosphoribosylformylglycinamidine cyclo-ligase